MANDWSMAWGDADGVDDGDVDGGAADGPGVRVPPEHGAPDNEVPVTVPIDRLLASTGDVAIYIAGMSVYTRGATFTLEVRARPQWRAGVQGDVWESVHGHGRGTDRLLLGVQYADGRRCSNLEGPFGSGDGVQLWARGSSGGGRAASADWYLSPLPPPGELQLHCAWPGVGIEESVISIDASAILEAAGRVRVLWPWEPERHEPRRPARPHVPEGGWFAALAEPRD